MHKRRTDNYIGNRIAYTPNFVGEGKEVAYNRLQGREIKLLRKQMSFFPEFFISDFQVTVMQ